MQFSSPSRANDRGKGCGVTQRGQGYGHGNIRHEIGCPGRRYRLDFSAGDDFGIRDARDETKITAITNVVVSGSRIIEDIENSPRVDASRRISFFWGIIRVAINRKGIPP